MAKEIGHLCGEISTSEVNENRPMLTSLVVRTNDGLPGDGFFKLARQLKKLSDDSKTAEMKFWEHEKAAVYEWWKVVIKG